MGYNTWRDKGHSQGSKKYLLARNQRALKQNWLLESYIVDWQLPHSAPSWILSQAENLASSSLQDGATKWHYFL